MAAVLGVLHRVADDIDQNLPQAEGVAQQVFLQDIPDADLQGLVFLDGLGADDNGNVVDQIRQGEGLLVEGHAAAVNAGHVQYVVDQAHQMGGGGLDLAQAVVDPGLFIDVGQADGGHTHNCVHRGADIVGHVGQKAAFGLICRLGIGQRLFQGRVFLYQPLQLPRQRGVGLPQLVQLAGML